MTEKNQKYQIIKFDSFDFFDYFEFEKNLHTQTDRPTDIWPYRSDLPLKKYTGSV